MDPKKVQELKLQQEEESRKMNKFKDLVQKKKNEIAKLGTKILEEEQKRPFMGS